MMQQFWYRVFRFAMRRLMRSGKQSSAAVIGNRRFLTALIITQSRNLEVKVIIRDRAHADTYTREELVRMLETVRANEERMGWKVPQVASAK